MATACRDRGLAGRDRTKSQFCNNSMQVIDAAGKALIALVRNVAQQVAVLQEGAIVEDASTEQLFHHPSHDYTKELLKTTPRLVS